MYIVLLHVGSPERMQDGFNTKTKRHNISEAQFEIFCLAQFESLLINATSLTNRGLAQMFKLGQPQNLGSAFPVMMVEVASCMEGLEASLSPPFLLATRVRLCRCSPHHLEQE